MFNIRFMKKIKGDKINWGIIGCGKVCEVKSGPAFQKTASSVLKAVMRRDKEKVIDFAHHHGVEKWYTNAFDLIYDPEIDAIYVATPPNTHAMYAIQAMKAQKPVYVEKPMAMNYTECLEMIQTSHSTGTPLFVAYYRRFFPYFLRIKELLDKESIGTILMINLTSVISPRLIDSDKENPPWHLVPSISGGGYFFDLACHQLDILDFLFGPVQEVFGFDANRAAIYKPEDTLAAVLKFQQGPLAACSWTYVGHNSSSIDRIEIFGTQGKLEFSIGADKPIRLVLSNKAEEFAFEKPVHVEMPMIEHIVSTLLSKNLILSNMESAARTSYVMDKILKR
jgi:1,5-anhydro-D-fructose reductase (1,5-anhydro-D-mannitol-forming)